MNILMLLILPLILQAKVMKVSDVPWFSQLIDKNIQSVHVCGDANILLTQKSLLKNFLVGSPPEGYLFTNMLSQKKYYEIMTNKNLNEAKVELEAEFKKSQLWILENNKPLTSIGAPSQIDFPLTATIKDCVEGAKTTLGMDCSRHRAETRKYCCMEKFVGPVLHWGDKQFSLSYSPDPSVQLKILSKKAVRFCNVQDVLTLKN